MKEILEGEIIVDEAIASALRVFDQAIIQSADGEQRVTIYEIEPASAVTTRLMLCRNYNPKTEPCIAFERQKVTTR